MINLNTDDADMHALLDTNERGQRFKRMLYENVKVQKYVPKLLKMFDEKGLLDVQNEN